MDIRFKEDFTVGSRERTIYSYVTWSNVQRQKKSGVHVPIQQDTKKAYCRNWDAKYGYIKFTKYKMDKHLPDLVVKWQFLR